MGMLKKAMAVIAAMAVAVIIAVPASASGTLSVIQEGQDAAHDYAAYRLLEGKVLENGAFWDIHIPEKIPGSLWEKLGMEGLAPTELAHLFADGVEGDADGSFAVSVADAVISEGITPDLEFTSGEEREMDDGYWLVTSDDAQPVLALIGGGKTLEISEKSSVPKVEKEIGEVDADGSVSYGKAADTGAGKRVPYRITGTLPSNYNAFGAYTYVVRDSHDEGISVIGDSVKVKTKAADGSATDITEKAVINVTDEDLSVTFENLKEALPSYTEGDVIIVEYDAVLTGKADAGNDSSDNTAWVEYTRSPTCKGLGKSAPDSCRLYTWELDIVKLAGDTGKNLPGAGFTIRDESGAYVNTDGTITSEKKDASTWTSGEDGRIEAGQLDSGTYTVTETVAPEGYRSAGTFMVKIEADYSDESAVSLKLTASGNASARIVDSGKGSAGLEVTDMPEDNPETGDRTGTVIWIMTALVGLAAAFAGGILLWRHGRGDEGWMPDGKEK